jgi:hypothetical protein
MVALALLAISARTATAGPVCDEIGYREIVWTGIEKTFDRVREIQCIGRYVKTDQIQWSRPSSSSFRQGSTFGHDPSGLELGVG